MTVTRNINHFRRITVFEYSGHVPTETKHNTKLMTILRDVANHIIPQIEDLTMNCKPHSGKHFEFTPIWDGKKSLTPELNTKLSFPIDR